MNRLQTLLLASMVFAGLGLAASAATKTMTTTTTTTTTTSSDDSATAREARARKGHCVTSLTKANQTACFDTFTEAVAAATGGKVADAPADVGAAMRDSALLTRLNASTEKKETPPDAPESGADVMVLTIYCDKDFEGCSFGAQSQTWVGPRCNDAAGDIDSSIAYVGDYWNDDFESFKGFNNCWAKVFEHINFGGASTPLAPSLNDLGVLNDEGSSITLT